MKSHYYVIGVGLYEMETGQQAFEANTTAAILMAFSTRCSSRELAAKLQQPLKGVNIEAAGFDFDCLSPSRWS